MILTGVAIGVVVSFLGVGGGLLASGSSMSTAIGLGAFVAFWGGLGFGAMLGGVAYAIRVEAEGIHAGHEAPAEQTAPAPAPTATPATAAPLTGDLHPA
jgi:hypothetical protein